MGKILVVVDMQNDFIDGSLGTKEAVAIVPAVKEKITKAAAEGTKIIFTRDTHYENYMETLEGQKLPVKHCIKDTFGWEIREELKTDGAVVYDKPTFGITDWNEKLGALTAEDEIEVCGLCTDICVLSNALILRAYYPNTKIKVDAAACAGVTPATHQAALDSMRCCQIDVI